MKIRLVVFIGMVSFAAASVIGLQNVSAAEKKKPAAVYWMDLATDNFSMPGMSDDMSDAGPFGLMPGMPQFGPKKSLRLQLSSPRPMPASPEAFHDIPPGQMMGRQLPLEVAVKEKTKHEHPEKPSQTEKPKMRMLIYWGCSEEIAKGQPRIIDTSNMSSMDFGREMSSGHMPSAQYPPRPRTGAVYADWPNSINSEQVPKDSSLQGDHFVHGNYSPDIRFSVPEQHDFMPPVTFTSVKGSLSESLLFSWKKIPTATGYFAQAIGHNENTGEMIFWTSSDAPNAGFGLLDYMPPTDVRKFVKEKVVMRPDATSCAIPKGIFSDTKGAMLQFIGYGDEMNLAYPPRPKDPKLEWNPIWTLKLRNKSTGFTQLGAEDDGEKRRSSRSKKQRSDDGEDRDAGERRDTREKKDDGGGMKKLRGIFGF